ncbi:MAG: magnesium/cobalt transporter CorA [Verrucomicrobia bacterium]|nr:magnesium/cobalt transporter CorA [Verrucomicrobiota bacterium]
MITSLLRDATGRVTKGDAPEAPPADANAVLWVDLRNPTPDEADALRTVYGFNEFAVEDALGTESHPKIESYDEPRSGRGCLFLTVEAVTLDLTDHTFATHQVSFFLGRNYLVSVHTDSIPSVDAVRDEAIASGRMRPSSDLVMHAVLDQLVDNYKPIIELLERHINNAEDVLLRSTSRSAVNVIFELKRDIMRLRRTAALQREVMHRLSRDPSELIPPKNQLYFRDLYDSVFHVYELSNWHREMITGLLEVHLTSISNRTNEIMRILTIIAVVGMPLTLIAGIFGTNFSYVPFMKDHATEPTTGFWYMVALMCAVTIATLTWFKVKKWF